MKVLRLFRLRYCWRNGGKTFSATTVWRSNGNAEAALRNFLQRNAHVISCCVLGEVQ